MGPAQKTAPASAGAKTYRCPKCGKVFSTRQALGGHLTGHRDHLSKKPVARSFAVGAEVAATLRDVAEPLRVQRAEIAGRLTELELERGELKDALKRLDEVLTRIDPTAVSKNAKTARAKVKVDDGKKLDVVFDFLEANADLLEDGLTAGQINRAMKERGVQPVMSPAKTLTILQVLQERGVVRADRITQGGGMAYKLVGRNGNKEE